MKRIALALLVFGMALHAHAALAPQPTSVSATTTPATVSFSPAATFVDAYNVGTGDAYVAGTYIPACGGVRLTYVDSVASVVVSSDTTSTVYVTGAKMAGQLADGITRYGSASGCSSMSGGTLSATSVTVSGATASRIAILDSNKAIASNASVTTGALPKSVSSGASLAASAVSDDGTNVTVSEPLLTLHNVQGNESTFALTSGAAAATFVTVTVPSNSAANLQVEYSLEAASATPHWQAFGGTVLFNAVNVGGSITCTTGTPTTSALATDSGGSTLTGTFSCADGGSGALLLKVTDTTSLTPTTNRIRYRVRALAGTVLAVTPS